MATTPDTPNPAAADKPKAAAKPKAPPKPKTSVAKPAAVKPKPMPKDTASTPQNMIGQVTDTARKAANRGKDNAANAIDELVGMVEDVAKALDERLGANYGQYARKAAAAVAGVSDNLKTKDVDELLDDARELVRKQPAIAIGAAAAVGFALTRLVKAGEDDKA